MTAGSHPPQRSISFQDTSYGRRSFGRPKSGNIAVLSPHPPVIGPHAPADRAVVILGFPDRGSPDLAASVVVLRREGLNANLYYRWSKEFLEAGKKRLVGDTTREARRMVHQFDTARPATPSSVAPRHRSSSRRRRRPARPPPTKMNWSYRRARAVVSATSWAAHCRFSSPTGIELSYNAVFRGEWRDDRPGRPAGLSLAA